MSEAIENCDHICNTCEVECELRSQGSADFLEPLNARSYVKNVIGIVSGKGGVGKSLVTSLLAVKMCSLGKRVAILDADITGPSIPKAFGLDDDGLALTADRKLMIPATTATGIQVVSTNLLLPSNTDPVIWRGPVVAGAIKQFWSEVLWERIEYMFVDMPPGTGDVPLTVFQSLPVDGIIIVTSPQDLVSMIVEKAVNMAIKMDIPIIGIIENMSYLTCPHCGEKIRLFGESHVDEIAEKFGLDVLAHLPIDPKVAAEVDEGRVEYVKNDWMDAAAERLLAM